MFQRLSVVLVVIVVLLFPCHIVAQEIKEVVMSSTNEDPLGLVWTRLGQRLTIPNRLVTAIGYRVCKFGNVTGDVIISMRDFETDDILYSAVCCDASELPEKKERGYQIMHLDEPMLVNQEVIICAEFYTGNETAHCLGGYYSGNKTSGETYMNYNWFGSWHDIGEAEEGAYYYAYIEQDAPQEKAGFDIRWVMIPVLLGAGGAIYFTSRRKRTT